MLLKQNSANRQKNYDSGGIYKWQEENIAVGTAFADLMFGLAGLSVVNGGIPKGKGVAENADFVEAEIGVRGRATKGFENIGENILPNVEKVRVDNVKLKNYALDPNHPTGGNKAKVFESSLGYNQSNAEMLIEQIQTKLPNSEAIYGVKDQFGQRITVDMPITGPNGKTATVRTGWIVEPGATIPRMTTIYVK